MKKNTLIALVVAVIAVLLAIGYLSVPGTVPQGQRPLVSLSSHGFSDFQKAFDEGANVPRLVLLLSPT